MKLFFTIIFMCAIFLNINAPAVSVVYAQPECADSYDSADMSMAGIGGG